MKGNKLASADKISKCYYYLKTRVQNFDPQNVYFATVIKKIIFHCETYILKNINLENIFRNRLGVLTKTMQKI